ncbi:MAG: glycosyltransferase family 39 protein [Anaerolineae bacterium]|nr:glycosyltransferase family 39 protein [Anaerolineae bacterium]
MFASLNIYDEGIIVYGATRILQGELPYRDFWTQYSPGQFYTLAGLFSIFGTTIMVERWWDVTSRALLSISLYLVAAQLSSRITALLVWALGAIWLAYYGFFGYPIFQGLAFSFLSIYFVLRSLEEQRPLRRDLIAAGLFLGLTALFRHDMAIYLAVAEVIVLIAFAWSRRSEPQS